jgi:hypothetical protein
MPHPTDSRPAALTRMVSSFVQRADGALVMVLAADAALLALLADGLRGAPEYRPVLLTAIVPILLFGASLLEAGRGLVPRGRGVDPDGAERLRVESQRFARKWNRLKRAAPPTFVALLWRFVAIQLA